MGAYETDFYAWSCEQAELLGSRQFDKIDIENIKEEIESLGKSDKRSIKSSLIVLILHLIKIGFSPEGQGNSKSWKSSIRNSRRIILDLIEESPSLKEYPNEILEKCYQEARKGAQAETGMHESIFPRKCPWKIGEILNESIAED